jgi:hypothetical protein
MAIAVTLLRKLSCHARAALARLPLPSPLAPLAPYGSVHVLLYGFQHSFHFFYRYLLWLAAVLRFGVATSPLPRCCAVVLSTPLGWQSLQETYGGRRWELAQVLGAGTVYCRAEGMRGTMQ